MKLLLLALIFCSSLRAFAIDCSTVKPFVPRETRTVTISVSKFAWKNGAPTDEVLCRSSVQLRGYDVRGREEDAYYCLKPDLAEVVHCPTTLNGDTAEVHVVPASWIRRWTPKAVREYRFHAYVVKTKTPEFFYDLFSRSLQPGLRTRSLTLEGALKTGPANPDDGFWVRAEFEK